MKIKSNWIIGYTDNEIEAQKEKAMCALYQLEDMTAYTNRRLAQAINILQDIKL